MFDLLRRLLAMRRLVREDRGEELDRVLQAMEEGARFHGASGVMLLTLAKDGGHCDFNMRGAGRRTMLTNELLGAAYARKVTAYIRRPRADAPFDMGEAN